MLRLGSPGVGWLNTLRASTRKVRVFDSDILIVFRRFASKLLIPGPVSGFSPSEPICPGAAFRKTIFPLASASAVRVQKGAIDEATLAHAGSGTLWYCWEKKLPNASPFLSGQTTSP